MFTVGIVVKYILSDSSSLRESLREEIWENLSYNEEMDRREVYQPEKDGYKVSRITVGNDIIQHGR